MKNNCYYEAGYQLCIDDFNDHGIDYVEERLFNEKYKDTNMYEGYNDAYENIIAFNFIEFNAQFFGGLKK